MTFRRFGLLLSICLYGAASSFAAADDGEPPGDPSELPWSLRSHYTITSADGRMFITYAGDNAQWNLDIKGAGTVLKQVGAAITLADGSVIDVSRLGMGDNTRGKETSELGESVRYKVAFNSSDGVTVLHSIAYHQDHPFYGVRLEMTNSTDKPMDVAKISAVVIPPGGLRNLSAETTVSPRRLSMVGAAAVLDTLRSPLFVIFYDPVKNVTLAMGGLSIVKGRTEAVLQQHEGNWQGETATVFDPPVRLDPGATLSSDPVWIAFTIPTPADVDMYYAWAQVSMPNARSTNPVPDGWVTVPDGDSFAALERAAGLWQGAGIGHALVPVTWEGRPGSLEGAQPLYPKDMRTVAMQLRAASYTPGITVDPLAVEGGHDDWTAVSVDGQRWVDPATAAGMDYGTAQMERVARWGFSFYAVAPSLIPDEILRHFNITRAQAGALAFDMMAKAAKGAPVVVTSKTTLGGSLDDWLPAAASTSRLHEYSVVVGPVRFDADQVDALSADVVTAMAFFGGPIEVVGKPSPSLLARLRPVFPKPHLWPRAIDSASTVPKLWQVHVHKDTGIGESLAIVSFPGARPATEADTLSPSGESLKIWRGDASTFLEMLHRRVSEDRSLSSRPSPGGKPVG